MNSIATAIAAVALFGCADESAMQDPMRLNFKVTTPDNQLVTNLPSETSLLISVETKEGDPLYTLENVSFSKTDDGFSTSSLNLQPGEFVLTEFMLVNSAGKILYTIPENDSRLAGTVDRSLGIDFRFDSNSESQIEATALEVNQLSPADFGRASFSIQNSFQVMVSEGDSKKAVTAHAMILHGSDTVATFVLPPKKSRIAFDGNPNESYTLVVSKDACAPSVHEFSLSSWAVEYRNRPLKISLAPALTMLAEAGGDPESPFSFYLSGPGSVQVNWGDGAVETIALNNDTGTELAHNYTAAGQYPITITGDIDKIWEFYSFYGQSVFRQIHFRHLTSLSQIRYGLTSCPSVIDLSHNSKLEFAMLPHLANMQQLILPVDHKITFLEIEGYNNLSTLAVDAVIDNLHANVTKYNLTNGLLALRSYWAQDETDLSMVGPPSSLGMEKLLELQNNYGWSIRPLTTTVDPMSDSRIRMRKRS
jgi:hypothetical protein